MRTIKQEVKQCMTDFSVAEGGEPKAGFVFPEDFIGFQGHFPGNKILPGICQIQCALAMLEKWKGKGAALKEIVTAKFFSPVLPSEKLVCEGRGLVEGDGAFILRVSFNRDNKKVSEMKLKVNFKPDNSGKG